MKKSKRQLNQEIAEVLTAHVHRTTPRRNSNLVPAMKALPEYHGWQFSYEYPGLFRYSHPNSHFSVFFTPDYSEDATLPIEVQDEDGGYYEEYSSVLPLPRTGRTAVKIFNLVRPTLDKLHSP